MPSPNQLRYGVRRLVAAFDGGTRHAAQTAHTHAQRQQPAPPPPKSPISHLPSLISKHPLTALAPMQDVTDIAFMRVIAHYGAPDYYFTEFFRVHRQSRLEKHILPSIDTNDTGRPVFAQLIGENPEHLARAATELLRHKTAGIDLNLGCPAPKVYKKNVGGGLLRDLPKIDEILTTLRAAIPGLLTVKMRTGFADTDNFDAILALLKKHNINLLSLHARTVAQLYRGPVSTARIAHAVQSLPCPVLANGEITTPEKARDILRQTAAAGVMIGRHAIRNPWIFKQCREIFSGKPPTPVTHGEVREYIDRLYEATRAPGIPERAHINRMKKFLNFVGQAVDPEGKFLREMRHAQTAQQLHAICDAHLTRDPQKPYSLVPHKGLIARPNCEN